MNLNENQPEKEILNGLRAGSEACFDTLFHKYSGAIYNVCRHYFLSQADAEEVVQEVFLKIWENRAGVNPDLSFKSYLYTIAKNIILKGIRRKAVEFAFQTYLKRQSFAEKSVERQVFFNQLQELSREVIDQLSPKRKQVFVLGRFEGMSNEEIASHLGLSKRTVEHHLYHAQKFVRKKLLALKPSPNY